MRSYKKYLQSIPCPILIICGPSGVGKSTLVKKLGEIGAGIYQLSISYTTRDLTEEEKQSKLYVQVSVRKFKRMVRARAFTEWNYYSGNDCYYGTPWFEIERILAEGKVPAFDIDINGLINLDKKLPRSLTYRLYLDVSPQEQLRRLLKRGRKTDTPEKIQKRLETAIKEKKKMLRWSKKDPELFSEIKDYNNADASWYPHELINRLHVQLKKAPNVLIS